jgi:hypothetical protein
MPRCASSTYMIYSSSHPLYLSPSFPHLQDESSALAKSALAAYQYDLKKMSLRAVNVLLVNPGKKVRCAHLHAIFTL